jgi:phage/plasmid-associated DNA primase
MNLLKNLITETFQKGRKSYGKEIEWNSVTKFIFSANDLPNLQAKNGLDFFGRFDYIEFAHDFAKLGDRKYNVYDEIYDQEAGKVLSYIARYKGKYTFQPVAEDIRAWWLNDADSVYAWIKNCKIEEVKDANSAYAEYKNFCAIWKFEVFTYKYFKKCLSVYNVKTEKVIEGTDDDGEEPDSEEDGDLE